MRLSLIHTEIFRFGYTFIKELCIGNNIIVVTDVEIRIRMFFDWFDGIIQSTKTTKTSMAR
jgi:hypothetical protein